MPLQATSGAASYDAFGGGVAAVPVYIEQIFSTYLYTGNGSTQTITNGIDLAGEGGLVWIKSRNNAFNNILIDTVRGQNKYVVSNDTSAQGTSDPGTGLTSFTTTGFNLGNSYTGGTNTSGSNNASWTFRKQPKFFDVVTFTAPSTGATNFYVNHSLGSVPGCVFIKGTNASENWTVCHRGITNSAQNFLELNTTNSTWNSGVDAYIPTSTNVMLRTGSTVSAGVQYVMYLFAHNAGGFGLTGTDNVITCGSFTTDGSGNATVSLGYEPQWVLQKIASGGITSGVDDWKLLDTMRGFTNPSSGDVQLKPNTSDAEQNTSWGVPTATGFTFSGFANATYIYIAIRRGPMKVPTSGTSVFAPVARAGTSAAATVTAGFPVDMTIIQDRTQNSFAAPFDRLRGATNRLFTPFTSAEASEATTLTSFAVQNGFTLGTDLGAGFVNTTGDNYINWMFRRAPSYFDEVCWSTTGSAQTINHNLGVVPELMIRKVRNGTWESWMVYAAPIGNTKILYLDQTAGQDTNNGWNNQTPTATQFFVNNTLSGYTMVTYLFATCAGVSKVGSYTGTGTTQQINCGFTGGARFVLIKRTDASGSWYVWDVARGIVSGNDPYLLLNSTAAEVTNTDYIDTYSAGFEISSTAPSEINASGGTFIFLAIA